MGKGLAFINLTNRFFENTELLDLVPPGLCVLEVLETVEVTDEVVQGVKKLRAAGHMIALDDFEDDERFERLLPLADIIKYDITQHTVEELALRRETDLAAGRLSLAERVETHEEFETLSGYGFNYFQGYYFAKPKIISGSKLPANRVALIQLIAEINNPESSIDDLAEIVGRDVSLSVRTLRYVNSPINGLSTTVSSIKQAAVLLGRSLIRNWVTLLVMSKVDDKPSELIKLALIRARFCQLLAVEENADDARSFTFGLLSLLDAFMGSTMVDALSQVALSDDMRDELLNGNGDGGRMVRWAEILEQGGTDGIPEESIDLASHLFRDATLWADEIVGLL